jgi:uncharacterized protein YjbJ (UPF0337 family)
LTAQLLLLHIYGCNYGQSLLLHKGVEPMNQDQVKGKWNQLKGEIKKKWAGMTDDDLLEAEGDINKLSGKIQERTGDRKEDIRKWLDERYQ